MPAESSLVVHKRLWSSNYVSECKNYTKNYTLKCNWSSRNGNGSFVSCYTKEDGNCPVDQRRREQGSMAKEIINKITSHHMILLQKCWFFIQIEIFSSKHTQIKLKIRLVAWARPRSNIDQDAESLNPRLNRKFTFGLMLYNTISIGNLVKCHSEQ